MSFHERKLEFFLCLEFCSGVVLVQRTAICSRLMYTRVGAVVTTLSFFFAAVYVCCTRDRSERKRLKACYFPWRVGVSMWSSTDVVVDRKDLSVFDVVSLLLRRCCLSCILLDWCLRLLLHNLVSGYNPLYFCGKRLSRSPDWITSISQGNEVWIRAESARAASTQAGHALVLGVDRRYFDVSTTARPRLVGSSGGLASCCKDVTL